MAKRDNDLVPVKGYVTRKTAEEWQRGNLRYKNGLRQAHGRPSLNSEQPDVWIDNGPTFGQMVGQAFKEAAVQAGYDTLYEDVIPAARYLFRTEGVPFIQRKIHEALTPESEEKRIQADLVRRVELTEDTVIDAESEDAAEGEHATIINLADYRRAAGLE